MTFFTTNWSCKKEILNNNETLVNQEASYRATCIGTSVENSTGDCPITRKVPSPINKTLEVVLSLGNKMASATPANASTNSTTQCVSWTVVNGSIQFSSFADLDNVIGPGAGQAHHIVPKQLCDDFGGSQSALHPVLKSAAYGGFHPNDGYNGYRIPTANHSGSHPKYTDWVKYQLDQFSIAKSGTYSTKEANKWVQCKLIPQLRVHIAATIATNPAKNVNTYFSTLPLMFIGL